METGAVHPQHPPLTVKPKRGDLVLVHWVDITGDATGDPKDATLTPCVTPGFFHRYGKMNGVRVLIVSLTQQCDGVRSPVGSDAYPLAVVRRVEVLRRAADVRFEE